MPLRISLIWDRVLQSARRNPWSLVGGQERNMSIPTAVVMRGWRGKGAKAPKKAA